VISLSKLERLPRHQRLRKILKLIRFAEERLSGASGVPGKSGREFKNQEPPLTRPPLTRPVLAELAALLVMDPDFSPARAAALREARDTLKEKASPEQDGPSVRRALNTIKHILLSETGKQTADWDFLDQSGELDPSRRRIFPGMLIYLEDIRSPFNVGAIFRSAESFGVEKIILSPLCADPEHSRAKRSSMGCVDIVPWRRGGPEPLEELASTGLPVFALESGGLAPGEFSFPGQGIMLIGSEELGLSGKALDSASLGRLTIPSYGAKGSLNVAVAAGIALHTWAQTLI
jgi:TrmH family RNA methyltransferase